MSPIWAHLALRQKARGSRWIWAICRICSRKVLVSRGNTTNLRSHLRINHPVAFAGLGSSTPTLGNIKPTTSGQQQQLEFSEAFVRGTKYQSDSNPWRAFWLKKRCHSIPLRSHRSKPCYWFLINNTYFTNWKYFSQTAIPEKYLSVKDGIIWDLWYVVKHKHDAIHEPDHTRSQCKLGTKIDMETLFMPESHTTDNLAEALRSSFQEYLEE